MKPVILLDFDRTLFDTDNFWVDFSECLAEVSGVASSIFLEAYSDYTIGSAKSSYIFFDELLERYKINQEELFKITKMNLVNKHYLYQDAPNLLDSLITKSDYFELAILTFGQERFQNLKISLCKELKGIEVYITLLPKTEFINYYMDNKVGLLVDDKYGQNLPQGWVEVHIDRKSNISNVKQLEKDKFRIFGLGQLSDVLNTRYGENIVIQG